MKQADLRFHPTHSIRCYFKRGQEIIQPLVEKYSLKLVQLL